MKKTLLITLALAPLLAAAQTTKPIESFSGIKFGSSKAVVIAALKAKGAKVDSQNSKGDNIAFSNVKLGGRPAAGLLVRFVNNKVYEADYLLDPGVDAKVLIEYNNVVADFAKAYGDTKGTYNYTSPYKEGEDDGDTLTGLQVGKIDYHTQWFDSNKNSIETSINTSMMVVVKYQNDKLTDEAIAKQDEKNKSDL